MVDPVPVPIVPAACAANTCTLPKSANIQISTLVDCNGDPIGVMVPDCDDVNRLAVNNVETTIRVGDLTSVAFAPAVPIVPLGAALMTSFVDCTDIDYILVDVFADQPGQLRAVEQYTVASAARLTDTLVVTTAGILAQIIYRPVRNRLRFRWTNTGAANATVLEMTVTRVGTCNDLTNV